MVKKPILKSYVEGNGRKVFKTISLKYSAFIFINKKKENKWCCSFKTPL